MKNIYLLIFIAVCLLSYSAKSQELVYEPVNPNFGGSYLNYNWLLASAKAQNPFDDTDNGFNNDRNALNQFSESTKRQILNKLSRQYLDGAQPGDQGNGVDSENGTFEIGGLVIKVEEVRNGSMINIIDTDTGESTQIIL